MVVEQCFRCAYFGLQQLLFLGCCSVFFVPEFPNQISLVFCCCSESKTVPFFTKNGRTVYRHCCLVLVWFGCCLVPVCLAFTWVESVTISFLFSGGWTFPLCSCRFILFSWAVRRSFWSICGFLVKAGFGGLISYLVDCTCSIPGIQKMG